jgi:hypothetical protein
MHWILQNNLFNEAAYATLLETLERFSIPYSIHKVVPFVGELVPEPTIDHKNVICMGSYSLRHAAKKAGWNPGVFDLEPFNFQVQLEHWGDHMLNADAIVCKFKDVDFEGERFIRPIEDSKVFAGNVFDRLYFKDWQHKVCDLEEDYGNSLTKDTLVQVCPLKQIYAEYRFWIVNQKIVSASLYKRGDNVIYSSDVDQRFHNYVNQILRTKNRVTDITLSVENKGWAPHDAFVIDVADTDQGLKVVEINTLNSSGFYACNLTDLVLTLEREFNND